LAWEAASPTTPPFPKRGTAVSGQRRLSPCVRGSGSARHQGRTGGREGFAVDASLIAADANKQRAAASSNDADWQTLATTRRSVREYLDTLDDAAWGAASEVAPKFVSRSDPASQWTGAHGACLLRLCRQLSDRSESRDYPRCRAHARHSASGSRRGQNHDRPDRSMLWIKAADYAAIPLTALQRSSAGWSRKNQLSRMCRFGKKANGRMAHSAGPTSLSILLPASDTHKCPGGKALQQYRRPFKNQRTGVTKDNTRIYQASQRDCDACALKESCCPGQPRRKIPRSIHEAARDVVRRLAGTPEYLQSRRERKRSRCCSPISSALLRTCENWPSSSICRL
jgi:hypothetical protein